MIGSPDFGSVGTLAASALVLVAVVAAAPLGPPVAESRVNEAALPKLPAPADAPVARLPGFKHAHPRLPAPSSRDYQTLRANNRSFLDDARRRAQGGAGDPSSAILMEFLEPGSQNLELLGNRLLSLELEGRGADQTKALALAYDWLYSRWPAEQRARLLRKALDACDYEIRLIRDERLSPYNVILYNSPFQALMACAIATYGDDSHSAPVMNFTADLWLKRVLPAWRQVMGHNGGWHEGGEYVGVGIGQAIYEVPAMWRSATGEDLIASTPGIRGFLDFLVYRTQPDGTNFRWGDGAWFDKGVPDALALALELHNAAAYSLQPASKAPVPTAWPWGPLTDPAMFDSHASAGLPLTKVFDGIGLVVARSDWSPDATYVTFKAGDNYWSHSHLDQGAFTIFKGGPLAIDSGLYGPSYGADHHMNYSYQTIAHNTVTVTDPADNVPAPGKQQPRSIANDGGQRRVGSGWGVEAAPIDAAEWEAKRETYHTGRLEQVLAEDGLTVAVADITPAYTNSRSGEGTFSDRTRRVERFWRTFGYDRVDDVVVVFDQVVATKASFRKRWLLHTLEAPHVTGDVFTVSVPAQDRPGRAGGRLQGKVLLPKQAVINALGGHGFEFFVDDRNYAEGGKVYAALRKLGPTQNEPGAWRIEVSPAQDEAADQFLVVMLPTREAAPTHRVRLLESGDRVGCEIVGPKRTTRWWFERERNAAEIEVVEGGKERRHRAEGQSRSAPGRPGWLAWLTGAQ